VHLLAYCTYLAHFLLFFFFYGATARGGPWPPLQYASKPLDSLIYFYVRLSHPSQVRRHVIQPYCFWSSSASCCTQLSVHLFWDAHFLLEMRNVSVKRCRGNQNTRFVFSNFFFIKSYPLWENVGKYCRGGQATDNNMAYAYCMLGN
jgi:hypothetical protein